MPINVEKTACKRRLPSLYVFNYLIKTTYKLSGLYNKIKLISG